MPRRRGTGGVRMMIGTERTSVQLRDTCAYDVIFNINRIFPNLNSVGSTRIGQLKVVNRPSSFIFRVVRGDIGMSSLSFVHRHTNFGQMSRCTKRFLEELFVSFGVQFFVSNLDKIQVRDGAVQVRFTPGPNPPGPPGPNPPRQTIDN